MEHHSNIVPWQQLAERRRRRDRLGADRRRGAARPGGPRGAARARPEARRRRPRLQRARDREPDRRDRPPGPRGRRAGARRRRPGGARSCRSTWPQLGVDFYAFTGHKLYGPTGIGVLWARLSCCEAMPPFLGGGSMIRKVTRERHHLRRPAGPLRGRHPGDRPGDRDGRGDRWLDALGMERAARTRREIADYALERLAEVPGLRVFGPPPGRRTGSARSPSSSRASTPMTSPRSSTATASRSAPATTAPRC